MLQAGPVSALARGRASVLCLGILQLRRSPVRARRSSKNAGVIVRELRLTVAVWVPWVALAPLDSALAHTKADLTLFDFKGGNVIIGNGGVSVTVGNRHPGPAPIAGGRRG